MSKQTLIFEYGAEGGGAEVFRTDEGKITESGSSGGMLDKDEDPIRSWTKEFDTFEAWWKDFKKSHSSYWPYLYPIFIHKDIRDFIRKEITEYKTDDEYSKPNFYDWHHELDKNL